MATMGLRTSGAGPEENPDVWQGGRAILRTLVLADLVDSTGVVEALGDRRASELFAHHDRLARELIERFDGTEIDKTDGFFLLFRRPLDAVRFAVAYHEALTRLSEQAPELPALRARVGVHLGEVYLRENPPKDVARGAKPVEAEGLSKPLTARLMSLAAAGQTLLTTAAFQLAQRSAQGEATGGELQWIEHGSYRFQGVTEPVEVYEVGLPGKALATPPAPSPKAWPVGMGAPALQPRRWLRWRWAGAIVAVLAVLAAVWQLRPSRPPPGAVGEQAWIVLGTFQNLTDRPGLGEALGQGLRLGLEQSSFFHLLPASRLSQTLTLMRRNPDSAIDRNTGLEICEREGAAALVLGTVVEIGGGFDLSVEVVEPSDGRPIAVEKATARSDADILGTLDDLARRTRANLGESLGSIRTHSVPLEQVTTTDLEALRAYSLGVRALLRGDGEAAADLLRQAVQLDDEFATAHAKLGTVAYYRLGDTDEAIRHWNRALELTDRLSAKEKLYVEGSRAWLGPPSAMRRPWFLMSTLYPEEMAGHHNLAFVERWYERRYEAAAISLKRCLQTKDPMAILCWEDLGYAQLALGQDLEAVESFERGVAAELPGVQPVDGYLAVRHYADAARWLATYDEPPDSPLRVQDWLRKATYDLDRGDLGNALETAHDLVERIQGPGSSEGVLQTEAAEAALLEGLGRTKELLVLLRRLQEEWTPQLETASVGERFIPSLRLALLGKVSVRNGDVERGRVTLEAVDRSISGLDSSLADAYRNLLEAEILLAEGHAEEATSLLEGSAEEVTLFQLHETLARAYEARGDLEAARAELDWLREHRGLAFAEWLGGFFGRELHLLDWAKAAYDQGRLSERLGDTEAARRHYREVLAQWSEAADPPPLFQRARARLLELQSSGASTRGSE